MRANSARYFCNRECAYYPCHRVGEEEEFNCLFCYCPLYVLGDKCGGDFKYTKKGIKDCSGCVIPHTEGGYEHVMERIRAVVELGSGK